MRIAVCEDNEIDREIMEHFLNRYSSERSFSFELEPYKSGKNFLYDMEEAAYFDIAFLDIYMEDAMGNEDGYGSNYTGYRPQYLSYPAENHGHKDCLL